MNELTTQNKQEAKIEAETAISNQIGMTDYSERHTVVGDSAVQSPKMTTTEFAFNSTKNNKENKGSDKISTLQGKQDQQSSLALISQQGEYSLDSNTQPKRPASSFGGRAIRRSVHSRSSTKHNLPENLHLNPHKAVLKTNTIVERMLGMHNASSKGSKNPGAPQ